MNNLSRGDVFSICYHDVFEYPLKKSELSKWEFNTNKVPIWFKEKKISFYKGFYIMNGKEKMSKRMARKIYSRDKLAKSKIYARKLSIVPTILFIGVTGSLAMQNCKKDSDIDLMIITKTNTVWITRFVVWVLIKVMKIPTRKPMDKKQRDRLCTNIWIDEKIMQWGEKNYFTAHEIAQVVPVINKSNTYEKFLAENEWVRDFWTNSLSEKKAVKNTDRSEKVGLKVAVKFLQALNFLFFLPQKWFMKKKITTEKVGVNYAIFHKIDWMKKIDLKLKGDLL